MKKKQGRFDEKADLRASAEKQLGKKIVRLRKESSGDLEKVLHELSVHEIELEMQNEDLNSAQAELEQSRDKYSDLYDFAPVGYFTINKNGIIMEANLTGCRMLGIERSLLIKKSFSNFIAGKIDKDKYYLTRKAVLNECACGRCDLKMLRKDGSGFYAEILIDPVKDNDDSSSRCRVAVININKRKEAEQKLLAYQEQLRRLSTELSLSEEKIRNQVAVRIHDDIAQNLAIAKLKLDSVSADLSSVCDIGALEKISSLLGEAIENIRSITTELSPPVLGELGFTQAMQWLCENMLKGHDISLEFNEFGQAKPIAKDIQLLLSHAIRELLINVVKHAGAGRVTIETEYFQNYIRIKISDDGVGFDSMKSHLRSAVSGGFGLFNIRESLNFAGGSIEIESSPGKGTIVILVSPLEIKDVARDS